MAGGRGALHRVYAGQAASPRNIKEIPEPVARVVEVSRCSELFQTGLMIFSTLRHSTLVVTMNAAETEPGEAL